MQAEVAAQLPLPPSQPESRPSTREMSNGVGLLLQTAMHNARRQASALVGRRCCCLHLLLCWCITTIVMPLVHHSNSQCRSLTTVTTRKNEDVSLVFSHTKPLMLLKAFAWQEPAGHGNARGSVPALSADLGAAARHLMSSPAATPDAAAGLIMVRI